MILAVIILIMYLIWLGILAFAYLWTARFSSEGIPPQTRFSVVIPFRNEAEQLPALLASLQKIDYPSHLFEIILIDDASEDASVAIIMDLLQQNNHLQNWQLIANQRLSQAPKKDAIRTAIKISAYDWILTTDADCTVPSGWLSAFDAFIQQKKNVLVAGPVLFGGNKTILGQFQQHDGWSLQTITGGSFSLNTPYFCNGANLAYQKSAFHAVDGFAGNDHVASGDDVFLLEKMKHAFPKQVGYLKSREAIVTTGIVTSWKALIHQRVRWASKIAKQNSPTLKILGLITFTTNSLVLLVGILSPLQPKILPYYALAVGLKFLLDFCILQASAHFMEKRVHLVYFLISSILYPLVTVLVVLNSFYGSYSWKGRNFRKNA